MANISPRRNGEFLRVIFKLLIDNPEGIQAKDVLAHIENNISLTEFELGHYASTPDSPRAHKIVRFATIPVVKAGWMVKSKGIWRITEQGQAAFDRYKDPEAFYKRAQQGYREWKSSRLDVELKEEFLEKEAEDVRVTFERAEEDAWQEIREFLEAINPYDFQDLVAELLRGMGYYVSWISPPGKDQGIDIIAFRDPLGAETPRIKVQVKRMVGTPINVGGLRSFLSILGDDDLGIFVSAGGFTRDAYDEARTQERRKVTLIDLEKLYDLWVEHYDRLSEEARRKLPLKPIYFLAPE